jgi:hypothetical protein
MKKTRLYKIITVLIPISAIFLFIIRQQLIALSTHFPKCVFYSLYHLYCPSCGNTRSVIALLNGDLLASLRYNIVILIMILLAALGYIEVVALSFGKCLRLLPRRLSFYMCLIAIMVIYWIVRNFIPYLTP